MPTRLIKYLVVVKLQTLWQPWSFLGTRKQVQCLFVLLSGFGVEQHTQQIHNIHPPCRKTSEGDHYDQAGFVGCRGWRNVLPFFNHTCPVSDVPLTHWEESLQKHQENWSSVCNLHQGLPQREISFSSVDEQTQHFRNTLILVFALCDGRVTSHHPQIKRRGSGLLLVLYPVL